MTRRQSQRAQSWLQGRRGLAQSYVHPRFGVWGARRKGAPSPGVASAAHAQQGDDDDEHADAQVDGHPRADLRQGGTASGPVSRRHGT